MRFKEILYRLILWGAFVLLVPVLFIWLIKPDYAAGDRRMDQFYLVADRITAISLGSSHSRAVHFPSLGYNGYSFADDRGDIRTAVTKARYVLPYTQNLKYVLFTLSPGYLGYDRGIAFKGNDPDLYMAFQNAPWPKQFWSLPSDEQVLLLRSQYFTFETFKAANRLARDTIKNAFRQALGRNQEMFRNPCRVRTNPADFPHEFGIRNGYTREAMPAECLQKAAEAEARFHAEQIGAILKRNHQIRAENTKLLEELAQSLAEKDIKLILFIPPLPDDYYMMEPLRRLAREDAPYIRQILQAQNVRLYDFHDLFPPSSYGPRNRYFSDGNHLTLTGAKAFSKILGETVRGKTQLDPKSIAEARFKLESY